RGGLAARARWTRPGCPPGRPHPGAAALRTGRRTRGSAGTSGAAPRLGGMARANEEAAELLRELADLLSITGGDAFKIRAYEKAARAVAGHPDDISGLDLAGLRAIPAVGDAIARKILDYTRTGTIRQVEELRARIPAGVRALTAIPTLGPKKALVLYEELGVSSVDELEAAIRAG